MVFLILLLWIHCLGVQGNSIENAANSLGFYLLDSTLSEDELGLSVLESALGSMDLSESDVSLSSIVHSIHHRASLLRRKELRLLQEDSTLLAIKYPDPQFIGISMESSGIPRSFASSFIHYIHSHLVPHKDFLIGMKTCSNNTTRFSGQSFLHPELFTSTLPIIAQTANAANVKDVLSILILTRGVEPLNAPLLTKIRRKIAPMRLIVHIYGYKPSPEARATLQSLADSYHNIEGDEEDISKVFGDTFLFRRYSSSSVKIIVPPVGNDVIFAQLVDDDKVMGRHVNKEYLFSELYSFNQDGSSVFLFDKSGRLLFQPSSGDLNSNIFFRSHVLEFMLREREGNIESVDKCTFSWKRVDTTPFIVLMTKKPLISSLQDGSSDILNDMFMLNNITIELHSQLETKLCRHFRSPANTDRGSIYLSRLAFKDPCNRPKPEDFMSYLNDFSDRNPGLRDGVKKEAKLIAQITPLWKIKAFDSGLNNYIVRRYVATQSGILYVYPGIRFSNEEMNPKLQEWYLKASKFPGQVTLSSPSLDPSGAGYVVTLSRALLHRRGRSSPGVLAMDMTLGYLYKVLINTLSTCKESNDNRCFIFDHNGYIIVHPRLIEGAMDKKYHLTHFEPQIINDLLSYHNFVQKTVCISRKDESVIHKRYEFNQSHDSPVISSHRNGCHSYEIALIPQSNLFLGIVSSSNCNEEGNSINFCPCNVEGDRCIICGSLELMECECPCTCSEPCLHQGNNSLPACDEEPQSYDPSPVDLEYLSDLPECLTTECGSRTKKEDCLGVLGCSWCQEKLISSYDDSEWVNLNSNSFCGTLDECFNGRLGQFSPYHLIDSSSSSRQKYPSLGAFDEFRSSPIGPIAGGIMGLFLFLSISVYCYRYYVSGSSAPSLNSNSDQVTRRLFDPSSLRTIGDDEDKKGPNYMSPPVHHLSSIEIPPNAIISPYRMNPGYRRPPPGTDSDHGYSTMTPFGDIDSDIAVISNPHPLRGLVAQSTNDSTSSRTSSPCINGIAAIPSSEQLSDPSDESVTVLGANQFIVAATIHMVDSQ